MTQAEVRMRCIEAVAQTGVREASRLVQDAKVLEEYVSAAMPARKNADKAS